MQPSIVGSRRHLLWSNFWALPCTMILGTLAATVLLLALDARGASAWMAERGWPLAIAATTAQELASGLVTVHAAFATLYFSITLLVLTLAASNLGVRLIDRWISDGTIRFTLGLLLSLLCASLILLFCVAEGRPGEVPRLTLSVVTAATILSLAWMTKALHHLGRTVHVDTSVARLGSDAAATVHNRRNETGSGPAEPAGRLPLHACATGYIDGIDHQAIVKEAARSNLLVGLTHGLGDFMMAGETIGWIAGGGTGEWVTQHIVCAPYRSGTSGPIFESNLIVEVAARALSPAVNDFYTARACCDRLAAMFAAALDRDQEAQWIHDSRGMPRLRMARQRLTDFMDGPLKALRQAAAPYPAVAIHMMDLLARLPRGSAAADGTRWFLLKHAEAFAEHTSARAEIESDRADVAAALEQVRRRLSAGQPQPPSPR